MSKKKVFLKTRQFLNRDLEKVALVQALVGVESWRTKDDAGAHTDTTLKISDCFRAITLDFYVGTDEGMREANHKLNTLINTLEAFQDALAEAHQLTMKIRVEGRTLRAAAKKKKKKKKNEPQS